MEKYCSPKSGFLPTQLKGGAAPSQSSAAAEMWNEHERLLSHLKCYNEKVCEACRSPFKQYFDNIWISLGYSK